MAVAIPFIPLILEAIKDTAIVLGVVITGAAAADQVQKARTRSQDLADAAAADNCLTCRKGPCAALAAGVPGAQFQGGAHGFMKGPTGDGLDSHHMPAAAASPLPRDAGPAIKMLPADHAMTASNGRMPGSPAFIAAQRRLVANGQFMAAFAMDVVDVRARFGDKYDTAIAQATAYAECLRRHGAIR